MANKKISDFTAATAIADGDLMEIETAGGNSRKVTGANLRRTVGAWWVAPPLASAFSLITGDATSPVVTDSADVGLVLTFGGSSVAGDIVRAAVETIGTPAAAWSYEVRMAATPFSTNYCGVGLVVRNVANNKNLTLALGNDGALTVQRRSMSAFSATAATPLAASLAGLDTFASLFWKVTYDGSTNIKFFASPDGKYWRLVVTEAVATYLTAAPDKIGFGIYTAVAGLTDDLALSVQRRVKSF